MRVTTVRAKLSEDLETKDVVDPKSEFSWKTDIDCLIISKASASLAEVYLRSITLSKIIEIEVITSDLSLLESLLLISFTVLDRSVKLMVAYFTHLYLELSYVSN